MQVWGRQTGAKRERETCATLDKIWKRCHSPSRYKTHVEESQARSAFTPRKKASSSSIALMSILVLGRNNKHSLETCYRACCNSSQRAVTHTSRIPPHRRSPSILIKHINNINNGIYSLNSQEIDLNIQSGNIGSTGTMYITLPHSLEQCTSES